MSISHAIEKWSSHMYVSYCGLNERTRCSGDCFYSPANFQVFKETFDNHICSTCLLFIQMTKDSRSLQEVKRTSCP